MPPSIYGNTTLVGPGQPASHRMRSIQSSHPSQVTYPSGVTITTIESDTPHHQSCKPWSLTTRILFAYGFVFRAYGLFLRWADHVSAGFKSAAASGTLPTPVSTPLPPPAIVPPSVLMAFDILIYLIAFVGWILLGQERGRVLERTWVVGVWAAVDLVAWAVSLGLGGGPWHVVIPYLALDMVGVLVVIKRAKRPVNKSVH